MEVDIISCAEYEDWNAILERCMKYDFYHLAEYHLLHQQEGQGILIVISEGNKLIAWPFLVRALSNQVSLGGFDEYSDVTSVYGYSGPISNVDYIETQFMKSANKQLNEILQQQNIIAAFSRLNPILRNDRGLCIGDTLSLGETVSIDLTLPEDEQFRRFRRDHRYGIRKTRSANVTVFQDTNWEYLSDFAEMYLATMQHVNARTYYYFDYGYFEELRAALGDNLHLFIAKYGDEVISGALFTLVNGIVQYHLSGTSPERREYAASKLIIDEVRKWATSQGATVFHLGGGLGSQSDGLFAFKAGFSPQRHTFKVWRHIVDPLSYDFAVQQYRAWLSNHGFQIAQADFFPLYRSPHKPLEK